MFHGRISLNSVLLLLLVNFVSGFRLELMYISLIVSIRSSPRFSDTCDVAIFHRNHLFHLYQQNKSSKSIVKFKQASIRCTIVLEAAKLPYATKTEEFITSHITIGELLIVFSIKVNLLYFLYLMDRMCCLLHLIKQNNLLKIFSKNSKLDASGISLPIFPSRTNLKLHNISITLKIVKKIITNLDSSKVSGPDCIPVVILKNCGPDLSHILAELFNMCLKVSCFPDCWKVSLVVPVFNNVGERSTAKNYHPVCLLSVVSLRKTCK